MKIEIEFVPHCDDNCGMGYAIFECPFCKKNIIDYGEVWYTFTGYGRLEQNYADVECDSCKKNMRIKKLGYDIFEVDM